MRQRSKVGLWAERDTKRRLEELGGLVENGPPAGRWDLEWLPPEPHLPTFVEVKAIRDDRKAVSVLTPDELEFRRQVVELGYSWAWVEVRYRRTWARNRNPVFHAVERIVRGDAGFGSNERFGEFERVLNDE